MKSLFSIISALLGWFAIVTQYVLMIQFSEISTTEVTLRFFSYFTILSNILVALVFTFSFFNTAPFFLRPKVQAADYSKSLMNYYML